jgi:two-component system, sensor histidine kinase and response regulator
MTLEILVAEDNESNQMLMVDMLDVLGHKATVGASGAETLALFKAANFDLVLMDCGMPDMDGFATTRALREYENSQGSEPIAVVALTGNVEPGIEGNCAAAGMNDYLAKPFTLDELIKKLDKWTPNKNA